MTHVTQIEPLVTKRSVSISTPILLPIYWNSSSDEVNIRVHASLTNVDIIIVRLVPWSDCVDCISVLVRAWCLRLKILDKEMEVLECSIPLVLLGWMIFINLFYPAPSTTFNSYEQCTSLANFISHETHDTGSVYVTSKVIHFCSNLQFFFKFMLLFCFNEYQHRPSCWGVIKCQVTFGFIMIGSFKFNKVSVSSFKCI